MTDDEADSVTHTKRRRAKMQEESDQMKRDATAAEEDRKEKQAERDHKSKEEEAQFLTQQAGLIQEGETREHLLQRIREMRENVPPPPPGPPPLSEFMKEQLRIEQKAGADAVAKAEQQQAAVVEYKKHVEAERLKREGTMETVHHPNPGQNEQFPAQNATLGKKK